MHCILDCSTLAPRQLSHLGAAAMVPVAGKPILAHVLDQLAGLGVRSVDLLATSAIDRIDELVEGGRPWGLEVTVHLTSVHSIGARARLVARSLGRVLFARGDELPHLEGGDLVVKTLWCEEGRWTGWAVAEGSGLDQVRLCDLPRALAADGVRSRQVQPAFHLSTGSVERVLAAQQAVLSGHRSDLHLPGLPSSPGLTVGAGCSIHASVRCLGPVLLGDHCYVGAGAILGPHAVLGDGCVVGAGALVQGSLVLAGNAVAPGQAVVGVVAGGREAADGIGAVTPVHPSIDLGALAARSAALLLLACLLPVLALAAGAALALGRRPHLIREQVVRPDAAGRIALIPLLRLRTGFAAGDAIGGCLGLLAVLAGHCRLGGATPLDLATWRSLPRQARHLYMSTRIGLLARPLPRGRGDRRLACICSLMHDAPAIDSRRAA